MSRCWFLEDGRVDSALGKCPCGIRYYKILGLEEISRLSLSQTWARRRFVHVYNLDILDVQ